MRSLSIGGASALAAAVAAYFVISTAVDSDHGLLAPEAIAFAVLIATLLLAVNHAYLLLRSVAYSSGRIDAGRSWVARRRELVDGPFFSGGVRNVAKRIAFFGSHLLLSTRATVVISGAAIAALSLVLVAAATETTMSATAGLLVALVPFGIVIVATTVARAAVGAVVLAEPGGVARPLVRYGKLPATPPSVRSVRSFGIAAVAAHLADPFQVVLLLAAVAVPVMAAVGFDGIELGLVAGLLVLDLAITNLVLFRGSRGWWRRLVRKQPGRAGPNEQVTFPRGTLPLTQRTMIDIVTPIGPASPVSELGGVLADHRGLVAAPVRWTVVTDPGRVDEVQDFLRSLFEMHGCPDASARVRAIACDFPEAGPKRNLGAQQATAPFVTFIDADDRLDVARLVAALNSALARDKALQSTHLFPFYLQRTEGLEMRVPRTLHEAAITHHHCARLWPSGIFRSGVASYGSVDFEDAILTLEMAGTIDHCLNKSSETAFLTYADHKQEPSRLTRVYKDSSHLLRHLSEQGAAEAANQPLPDPSPRERALVDVAIGRVAAEVAWRGAVPLERLALSLAEFAPYRGVRESVEVPVERIASSIEGVRARIHAELHEGYDRGLVTYIRDELAAKVPCTTMLVADGSELAQAERQLALMVGLMNADVMRSRSQSNAPTVFFNLAGDGLAASRRAIQFFLRQPHFRLEADPSIPSGSVEILDPATKSRSRLGDFTTDRLMSSRLLRLWDRFYPSMNEVEQARAHIILESIGVRTEASVVRLVAMGPSSGSSLDPSSVGPGVVTICCNSWVRQPERMAAMGAKILTAGDPIFHAGPSEYAHRFRADLASWLRADREHVFVTVARDIAIYLAELPPDVHDQVVAPVFDSVIDAGKPFSIATGRVQPYPNVMTLLMLPMAELLQPREVHLFGFDGGAKDAEEYWKYDPETNYSEELQQTVRTWHPEFFRVDYQEYRDHHNDHVSSWLTRLTEQEIGVRAAAPSSIPAVDAAFEPGAVPTGAGR